MEMWREESWHKVIIFRASPILLISLKHIIFDANAKENSSDTFNEKLIYNKNLFEGDLKLPREMIVQFYNFSSLPDGQKNIEEFINNISSDNSTQHGSVYKAVVSESYVGYNLWPNSIVKYAMDSTLTSSMRSTILDAIRRWQDKTCLIFERIKILTGDYILFTDKDPGCFSTSIGRRGGQQIINLQRQVCDNYGVTLHEIGHAIGFWHEQSRPDRDHYILLNTNNIESEFLYSFFKIKDFNVDNQGSNYDYGSIMHYYLDAFSKSSCVDTICRTMFVSNSSEYKRQGSPNIGHWTELSDQDIVQTNRLYSCPCRSAAAGIYGNLSILIRYGINLTIRDNNDLPNPYVLVSAIDCNGGVVADSTEQVLQSNYPIWNRWLLMGVRRWQFFRISVWDNDYVNANKSFQLTMFQTVVVSSTRRYHQKHCKNSGCNSYIKFDYGVDGVYLKPPIKSSVLRLNLQIIYYLILTISYYIQFH